MIKSIFLLIMFIGCLVAGIVFALQGEYDRASFNISLVTLLHLVGLTRRRPEQ